MDSNVAKSHGASKPPSAPVSYGVPDTSSSSEFPPLGGGNGKATRLWLASKPEVKPPPLFIQKKIAERKARKEANDLWRLSMNSKKNLAKSLRSFKLPSPSEKLVRRSLSLKETADTFEKYCGIWERSDGPQILSDVFKRQLLLLRNSKITRCVCLALGEFASPTPHVNSMKQLVALTKMLELLRTRHTITEVYVQDPNFNNVEIAFLTQLGYTVLQDPEAEAKMTSSTFFFESSLPCFVSPRYLNKCSPALYIGHTLTHIEEFYERAYEPNHPTRKMLQQILSRFKNETLEDVIPLSEYDVFGIQQLFIRRLKDAGGLQASTSELLPFRLS